MRISWTKLWVIVSTVIGILWLILAAIQIFSSWWKEQMINGNNNNQTMWDNSSINICNHCTYTDTKDPNYLNPRSDFLKWKEPKELAQLFLELQNQSKYRDACSLLAKRKWNVWCNVLDWQQVSDFSNRSKKLLNWYENIIIKQIESQQTEYIKTICVKYNYKLKIDIDPRETIEIMAYYFNLREDWEWELASRVCEYKQKWEEKRDCPISTTNKVCSSIF